MLSRRLLRSLLIVALAGTFAVVAPSAAWAGLVCLPDGTCIIVADDPGKPGGPDGPGGGSGDSAPCQWQGKVYPCFQDGWGWFNSTDGCYYIIESPPPPAGDEAWDGHAPGDGSVYRQRCFGDLNGTLVWRASPPPGSPGGPNPGQLALRAIREMQLEGPSIGSAPAAGGAGLVGLPVWLWNSPSQTTWGPIERSATAGGMTVTARAKGAKIVWNMGDGKTVTCNNAGTPYNRAYGADTSKRTCGYQYTKASRTQPGGKYKVTATTTWQITWWINGVPGTNNLTLTLGSETALRIDELQVITS